MNCTTLVSCLHSWQDLTAGMLSLIAAGVTAYLLWKQIEDTRRTAKEKARSAHQTSKLGMIHVIASIDSTIDQMKKYWESKIMENHEEFMFTHVGDGVEWKKSDILDFANFVEGLDPNEVSACTECVVAMQILASRIAPDSRSAGQLRTIEAVENYFNLLQVQEFLKSLLEYCRGRRRDLPKFGAVGELWWAEAASRKLSLNMSIKINHEVSVDFVSEIDRMRFRSLRRSTVTPPFFGSGLQR
jgi:hypothetical protein